MMGVVGGTYTRENERRAGLHPKMLVWLFRAWKPVYVALPKTPKASFTKRGETENISFPLSPVEYIIEMESFRRAKNGISTLNLLLSAPPFLAFQARNRTSAEKEEGTHNASDGAGTEAEEEAKIGKRSPPRFGRSFCDGGLERRKRSAFFSRDG